MQQPTRLISTPFAQEGEKTDIQNVTGESDNSATYRVGFPPITMQSIRLGGKPPKGMDFNGVLFDITENISFLCKGGRYQYSAGLSTLIGGYPEGSNLLLDDNITEVVSEIASNQNNPNTNMTGWKLKPTKASSVLSDGNQNQQEINDFGGAKWYAKVGGYRLGATVKLDNGDTVQSTAPANTVNPNVDMAGWSKDNGGLTPDQIKVIEIKNNSKFSSLLSALTLTVGSSCYVTKTSDALFEILTPFVASGRFLKWRFENTGSNFVAEPSDSAQAYVRPFLQTTVQDVFLEVRTDGAFSDFAVVGTPVVSGSRTYIDQIGDSLTLTGVRAKRLRLNYYSTTNAGKVKITINGSSLLVNLIEKDSNGDAVFDTYSTANASSQVFIADNLPNIDLTIKIEVVGKNDLSTDSRYYATTAQAYSKYSAYNGSGVPTLTPNGTLKIGGSAVDYAILFYPNNKTAAPSWGGSVHGWENRLSLELLLDSTKYRLSDIGVGAYIPCNNVQIKQTSDIFHHLELLQPSASVSSVWNVNSNGAQLGYSWKWKNPSFVTNGYTQMWTVYGGATGGAGGAKNGWCDRVIFGDGKQFDLSFGGSGEFGKVLVNEVLFAGTKPSTAETARNLDSGDTACLINISSVTRSFRDFINPTSIQDGVWVQDRATFKKMYAQVYRANGLVNNGENHNGLMSVQFYKHPNLASMIL